LLAGAIPVSFQAARVKIDRDCGVPLVAFPLNPGILRLELTAVSVVDQSTEIPLEARST